MLPARPLRRERRETLEASIPFQDWIVGVGLDSDERGNPPEKFAAVFARARELGYRLTMHCDIDQIGSIDNIRTVVHDIGTERIDHGTNIVEDPRLVDELRAAGIGLTCCPISNRFVTDDMKAKEIADLLRSGVRVTVNSDDPAYFGGYVVDNYLALAEAGAADRRRGGHARRELLPHLLGRRRTACRLPRRGSASSSTVSVPDSVAGESPPS